MIDFTLNPLLLLTGDDGDDVDVGDEISNSSFFEEMTV